jgi:hypothetical protein
MFSKFYFCWYNCIACWSWSKSITICFSFMFSSVKFFSFDYKFKFSKLFSSFFIFTPYLSLNLGLIGTFKLHLGKLSTEFSTSSIDGYSIWKSYREFLVLGIREIPFSFSEKIVTIFGTSFLTCEVLYLLFLALIMFEFGFLFMSHNGLVFPSGLRPPSVGDL